tara:strand:+ start:2748 stop:3956 length:1209 start_codon:yes stop_codon:yes gene_type:complete
MIKRDKYFNFGIEEGQNFLKKFFQTPTGISKNSGILLVLFSVLAILITNLGYFDLYTNLKNAEFSISTGDFLLKKTVGHWVNDGLMAIFFLVIGLEIKREILEGELSTVPKMILPGVAAIGGMLIPALIYLYINIENQSAFRGWAIPTATDIAFTLAILSIVGNKVPLGLKIFLLSLAIIDDLGAVLIIAFYYTDYININYIYYTIGILLGLLALNIFNIRILGIYIFGGLFLWYFILKTGIHATMAGVLLAAIIPNSIRDRKYSPLKILENSITPWVAFLVLPVFAFFNSDIILNDMSIKDLANPMPAGIMLGLLLGKPIGISLFTYLSIKMKICNLPDKTNMIDIIGVAFLCGIGFTMSLFIGNLAFSEHIAIQESKAGIFIGSILSAIIGYIILKRRYK